MIGKKPQRELCCLDLWELFWVKAKIQNIMMEARPHILRTLCKRNQILVQIEVDFSILKEKIELSVIYFCQGFPTARTTINPCCGDFPTHRCDHTAKAINKNGKSAEITIPSKVIWILLCIPYKFRCKCRSAALRV